MMMQIDVVTLFPEFFTGPLDISIIGRAQRDGIVQIDCHNPRDFTEDNHRTVDDTPYGGGPGMVMKPEPLFAAVESIRRTEPCPVVYLTPQGEPLTQRKVRELSGYPQMVMICGRYEGIDERVVQSLVTDPISIGDYVLSGGELAALVLIDAVVRLLPGALGNEQSSEDESFSAGLLEYPQYTRPAEFRGLKVPSILVNGHHAHVDRWRRLQALFRTSRLRPDILARAELSKSDSKLLADGEVADD